jgi:hypothetical protein
MGRQQPLRQPVTTGLGLVREAMVAGLLTSPALALVEAMVAQALAVDTRRLGSFLAMVVVAISGTPSHLSDLMI